MGNREDLLTAAKACLYDKGYARTTARDIATAAGVSLAAIGYHYGSKEALLNEALQQAMEEWAADLGRVLGEDAGTGGGDRSAATWTKVIESFASSRPLWALQFELIAHIDRTPDLGRAFAAANRQGRLGLVELFGTHTRDEEQAMAVGAVYQALLAGVAALWLVDPEGAPSGEALVDALRAIAAGPECTPHSGPSAE
jgi:AcrR family transcriptional regulator